MPNAYQSPTASLDLNIQAYSDVTNTSKWYQLSGRIGRLRYLSYQMLATVLLYLTIAIAATGFGALTELASATKNPDDIYLFLVFICLPLLPFIFYSAIIYPKRRLHDLNLSGWLVVLLFIPLVNALFSLYLMFATGSDKLNQYGYPPRPNRRIHYVGVLVPIAVVIIGILAAIIIPAYQNYI